jgi:hypothetical protein
MTFKKIKLLRDFREKNGLCPACGLNLRDEQVAYHHKIGKCVPNYK